MVPVSPAVNTPRSQNNSFNLSTHLADVFDKPAAKVVALLASKATADAGKTPTVVVLATSPPTVGTVAAAF